MASLSLRILPCLDSPQMAAQRRAELDMSRTRASELGRSAVEIVKQGSYVNEAGELVEVSRQVAAAMAGRKSLPPEAPLPSPPKRAAFAETRVQVTNETTLGAARRLIEAGMRPLALNFANGINPGGGFLTGAKAQEETLCRSSALFATLENDPMYEAHRQRPLPDSTDWAIYSPDVPVFRTDDGHFLSEPWQLNVITCAAPDAAVVGQQKSAELLCQRIHRVLAIARAFGYHELVLGAWACGAFRNDPWRAAADFREALECEFRGAFAHVVFAITDWSDERRFLGPFRDVFARA